MGHQGHVGHGRLPSAEAPLRRRARPGLDDLQERGEGGGKAKHDSYHCAVFVRTSMVIVIQVF